MSTTVGNQAMRPSESIVIPAGSLSGSVTLTAVQDALVEGSETIVVDVTGVTNGTESGAQQVTATIADDDVGGPPTVTLSLSGSPMAEAAGVATRRLDGHREQRPKAGVCPDTAQLLRDALVLGEQRCGDHPSL